MLRCQFLCHVLKALFFIKIALKLSYFCKKMQNFRALGVPPQATGGLRFPTQATGATPPDPQPPAAGGFAPRPIRQPPHCEFLATRLLKELWLSHTGNKLPLTRFDKLIHLQAKIFQRTSTIIYKLATKALLRTTAMS